MILYFFATSHLYINKIRIIFAPTNAPKIFYITMEKFTFAIKWHEILKPYSDDIRREVYDAIIEYVATGAIIEMQPVSRMAFDFIRYEIDEKERRKEERLAKKQSQAKAQAEQKETFDPDEITDSYIGTGKLSTPLVVQSNGVAVIVSNDKIHSFVRRCVSDMLDRELTPSGDENRFFNTLHIIASNRLDIIREDIKRHHTDEEFTDELWNSIVNNACAKFPK